MPAVRMLREIRTRCGSRHVMPGGARALIAMTSENGTQLTMDFEAYVSAQTPAGVARRAEVSVAHTVKRSSMR